MRTFDLFWIIFLVTAIGILIWAARRTKAKLSAMCALIEGTLEPGRFLNGRTSISGTFRGRVAEISRLPTGKSGGLTSVTLKYKNPEQIAGMTKANWVEGVKCLSLPLPKTLQEVRGTFNFLTDGANWSKYGPMCEVGTLPAILEHLDKAASEMEIVAARIK